MDIKLIKEVVNSNMSKEAQEEAILLVLANDDKVIPYIMTILNHERRTNKELLLDMNMELSRALIVLKDDNLKYNKKIIVEPNFVVGEIKKHYIKWKDYIRCNFKIDGLE